MTTYLKNFEIDWGWPQLSETERTVVRRHEAANRAYPLPYTLVMFNEAVAAASSALPGREIRARAHDAFGNHDFVARDGMCTYAVGDTFDEGGMFRDTLCLEDYRNAGVKEVKVDFTWPHDMYRALVIQASRLNRPLVWLIEKAGVVARIKGMRADANEVLPLSGERQTQSLILPIKTFVELSSLAAVEREDLSRVAQRVLSAGWPTIEKLKPYVRQPA